MEHPTNTWREDFTDEELLDWLRFRTNWVRSQDDPVSAVRSLGSPDSVGRSFRRFLPGLLEGDDFHANLASLIETFPRVEERLTRAQAPHLYMASRTWSDGAGNELQVVVIERLNAGVIVESVTFDPEDQELADREFYRLADQYQHRT